jgi:hypothetical protein
MDNPTIIPSDNIKFKKGLYVSLACTHCRSNHRRCNGEAPCSRCTKLNLECIYTKTRPRGGYRGKKNKSDDSEHECNDAVQCSQPENVQLIPVASFKMLLNYYADAYYQTTDFRLCPLTLPNPDHLSAPEQKFRVLSCVGYAALTFGHASQGHLFMDQAKQYLPQAMSSVTMDAAVGFYHLGLCHLIEQDNAAGLNFMKVCKNLASTLYNMQSSQGKVDLFVTGPYESRPTPQSIALKFRYYYATITVPSSYKTLQKRLKSLTKLSQTWDLFLDELNISKTIINLRVCGTEEEVLAAINSIELSARNFDEALKHLTPVYIHMFGAIKFAFLQDYVAMNEECDQFMNIFKNVQIHDLVTTKIAQLITYLWGSFNIPQAKIQELVTYAEQLSVNFPGYRSVSSASQAKYQDPLGILLQRRLTCSEESLLNTNVDPFASADVPVFDDNNFIFDDILEVTF